MLTRGSDDAGNTKPVILGKPRVGINKIITKKSYSFSVNLKSANAGASTFVFGYLSEDVSICIGNVYSVHGGLS